MLNFINPTFSPDGSKIYFRATEADGSEGLWWIPSSGGHPVKAVSFDDPERTVLIYAGITLASNRLYLTFSEYESDIWVMDLEW